MLTDENRDYSLVQSNLDCIIESLQNAKEMIFKGFPWCNEEALMTHMDMTRISAYLILDEINRVESECEDEAESYLVIYNNQLQLKHKLNSYC